MDERFEDQESIAREAGSHDPLHARWVAEIKLYEEEFKPYYQACKEISERYRDDKATDKGQYNVFWSQMENLKPAVFYYLPKVEVARRYKDKDPIGKMAGEILERATQYQLDENNHFNRLEKCRDDFLMYARGVAWVRYIPTMEMQPVRVPATIDPITMMPPEGAQQDPMTGEYYTEEMQEVVTKEEVIADYLHRADFGHAIARTWEEVTAVWRISYLTREECIKRFGEELGRKIPLDFLPKQMEEKAETEKSLFKKAQIYEVWDKTSRRVIWVHKGMPEQVLDIKPDPLELKDFFPCPRPCFGSMDSEKLIPLPDYQQYKTITKSLDAISKRISNMEKALQVKGLYDAAKDEIKNLFSGGSELSLVAVTNWASLMQSGGLDRCIEWMPIKEIAEVLRYMYEIKNNLKQDLYEISGMSDIVRGQTDPRETATAQRTKAQFATLRMDAKQKVFASFCRDVIAIMGEIVGEQFGEDTLAAVAGVESLSPEYQQAMPQIIELLKNDRDRCYRIDIQTDSTLALDEKAEQEQAVEFMNVLTQGLNDVLPVIQAVPSFGPVLSEALLGLSRKFKIGRSLEGALENAFAQIAQQPPQQPQQGQPQPDPAQQQAQQAGIDARIVASQNDAQIKQAQLQQDGQLKVAQLMNEKEYRDNMLALEAQKLAIKKDEADKKLQIAAMDTGAKIQQARLAQFAKLV